MRTSHHGEAQAKANISNVMEPPATIELVQETSVPLLTRRQSRKLLAQQAEGLVTAVVETPEVWKSAMAQVEKEGTPMPNSLAQAETRRHKHKSETDETIFAQTEVTPELTTKELLAQTQSLQSQDRRQALAETHRSRHEQRGKMAQVKSEAPSMAEVEGEMVRANLSQVKSYAPPNIAEAAKIMAAQIEG